MGNKLPNPKARNADNFRINDMRYRNKYEKRMERRRQKINPATN